MGFSALFNVFEVAKPEYEVKISVLKELVRKTEEDNGKQNSFSQEKAKNIAQRLTHIKTKMHSRQNFKKSFSDSTITEENNPITNKGSEKIRLLREQMEENKLKMAKRQNNKREIEEMVSQLKAKLDLTQQSLERSSELGRSMNDLSSIVSTPNSTKFKSSTDISFSAINIDKERIKFLENRVRILEKQMEKEKKQNESDIVRNLESKILDLEENLKEKECIIKARTEAVSLMSESLSVKGKNTLDLLEDTKQEMFKMQFNFIETEDSYKKEIESLNLQLNEKVNKISNLEEINTILENERFDLTLKNSKLESFNQELDNFKLKIEELKKYKENLEIQINCLESHNGSSNDINDIDQLKSRNEKQQTENENYNVIVNDLQEKYAEKNTEYNVLRANFSVLEEKIKYLESNPSSVKLSQHDGDSELQKLLDDSNKAMIKMKLKEKQLNKQIESFKKISDHNAEIVKLNYENEILQQHLTDLQDRLKLKTINTETNLEDDEIRKKLEILETTCQNQTSAIQLLQEEKLDMNEILVTSKKEVKKLMAQITSSEISKIDINHENLQDLVLERDQKILTLHREINEQKLQIEDLYEKNQIYISENVELLDKIEKLNNSSSSVESIEFVERLTQKEKIELESLEDIANEKDTRSCGSQIIFDLPHNIIQDSMDRELSDSLIKLREESSELMHKIELFTAERREVLEKMEILTTENIDNVHKVKELTDRNDKLIKNLEKLNKEKSDLQNKLEVECTEKTKLLNQLLIIQEKSDTIIEPSHYSDFLQQFEEPFLKLKFILENLNKLAKGNVASDKKLEEATECCQKIKLLMESKPNPIHRDELYKKNQDLEGKTIILEKEIEMLKDLISEQKQELVDCYTNFEEETVARENELQGYKNNNEALANNLKHQENNLLENNNIFKHFEEQLKNKQETVDALNLQIMELYNTMEETTKKLVEKDSEIKVMEELFKSKESSAEQFPEKKQIDKNLIEDMEVYDKLKLENEKLEERILKSENQNKEHIQKLKKFAANLKKKTNNCSELENKIKLLEEKHNEEKSSFKEQYEKLNVENAKLQEIEEQLTNKNEIIQKQHAELKFQLQLRNNDLNEIKSRFSSLQSEFDNLKLKHEMAETAASGCQTEFTNQNLIINNLQTELNSKTTEIEEKNTKIEKCKTVIKLKSREIQKMKNKKSSCCEDIEVKYNEVKEDHKKLFESYEREKKHFLDTISKLETLYDDILAKLHKNIYNINELEKENKDFREKIAKVESYVNLIEERRLNLNNHLTILDKTFKNNTNEMEKIEDVLISRLCAIVENDDVIFQTLMYVQGEKEKAIEEFYKSNETCTKLLQKLSNLENEFKEMKHSQELTTHSENIALSASIEQLKYALEYQKKTYEEQIRYKNSEIETLENDLGLQFEGINQENLLMKQKVEKLEDDLTEFQNENLILKEQINAFEQFKKEHEKEITWLRIQNESFAQDQFELQELRSQVVQDNAELHNLRQEKTALIKNHEEELGIMRKQFIELDSIRMQVSQNQTDDQVFIETENRRLKNLIREKNEIISKFKTENKITAPLETTNVEVSKEVQEKSSLSKFFPLESDGNTTVFDVAIEPIIKPKTNVLKEEVDISNWDLNNVEEESSKLQCPISNKTSYVEKQELLDKINVLELDQNRLESEKQSLQIKCGKMMKKLKQYKIRTEEFESKKSSALDIAILDEMKNQQILLEENLTVTKKSLTKENIEKKNLEKRVEILSSANERLIDLKEQQDYQVENLKHTIYELNKQIKLLESWERNSDDNENIKIQDYKNEQTTCDFFENDKDEWNTNETLSPIAVNTQNVPVSLCSTSDGDIQNVYKKNEELRLENNNYKEDLKILSSQFSLLKTNLIVLFNDFQSQVDANFVIIEEIETLKENNLALLQNINEINQKKVFNESEFVISDLNAKLDYKENEIVQLKESISKLQESVEIERNTNIDLENKILQIANFKLTDNESKDQSLTKVKTLQDKNIELENALKISLNEKKDMENELKVLNDYVVTSLGNEEKLKSLILNCDAKEIEISELKKTIEIVKSDSSVNFQSTMEKVNSNWQKSLDERCEQIVNIWKEHLNQKELEFKEIENDLKKRIEVLKTNKDKSVNKSQREDELGSNEFISNMQNALESQEMEIVSLKEQLAIRSAEYARLAAQHDPYHQFSTSSTNIHQKNNFSLLQTNQKSELDITLYMLHQREMRCEELTLELVNLLKERDTLQLKLSNAIRQIEDLKKKNQNQENEPTTSTSLSNSEKELNFVKDFNLDAKLSELYSLGYIKDRNILETQLEKIQEDLTNIPQEAVSQIVGLSTVPTTQPPSTVLLNWLLGKHRNNT